MEKTRGMPMPEKIGKGTALKMVHEPFDTPWTWNLLVEEVERLRKIERDAIAVQKAADVIEDVYIATTIQDLKLRVKSLEEMHTFKPQPYHQPWIWPVPYYTQPFEITCSTGPSK